MSSRIALVSLFLYSVRLRKSHKNHKNYVTDSHSNQTVACIELTHGYSEAGNPFCRVKILIQVDISLITTIIDHNYC